MSKVLKSREYETTHFGFEEMIDVGEWECHLKTTGILDRLGEGNDTHLLWSNRALGESNANTLLTDGLMTLSADWHSFKLLPDPLLQCVEILLADHDELHPARTVVLLPPVDQLLARISTLGLGL